MKKKISSSNLPAPSGLIERRIYSLRGNTVMLDSGLAALYGVTTGQLNQAVHRNPGRFPEDFMFQLTAKEACNLKSQFVISSSESHGGRRRSLPYAFTEQGVAMLSSVLRSRRAIQVNVAIMRAFVHLREIMLTHLDLASKIEALERKYERHDGEIQVVFDAIKKLLAPPLKPKRHVGFLAAHN